MDVGTLILEIAAVLAVSPVLHAMKWAAHPIARVALSFLPDLIGAYRRAKGLAGAPGAPAPVRDP